MTYERTFDHCLPFLKTKANKGADVFLKDQLDAALYIIHEAQLPHLEFIICFAKRLQFTCYYTYIFLKFDLASAFVLRQMKCLPSQQKKKRGETGHCILNSIYRDSLEAFIQNKGERHFYFWNPAKHPWRKCSFTRDYYSSPPPKKMVSLSFPLCFNCNHYIFCSLHITA